MNLHPRCVCVIDNVLYSIYWPVSFMPYNLQLLLFKKINALHLEFLNSKYSLLFPQY